MAAALAVAIVVVEPGRSQAEPTSPPTPPSSAAAARSVVTRERVVVEVADGVYAIRHRDAPDTNPQGNTTVIVGERDVMVIDSGYLPSSAREDIAQIRGWTSKPVRYLVNTHWHPDHVRGNFAYAEAFPGLVVIAHQVTPDLEEGYDVPNRARYRTRLEALEEQRKRGRGADGKKLTEAERRDLETTIANRRAVLREFENYEPLYPSVTFTDRMSVDLGGRTVELRFLGRGHSSGDVVAYVPRDRVLVAGDLVAWPVPYFFAGYPYEEIATLEALAAIDARAIVPGHGDVLYDRSYLQRTLDLMEDARAQVVREVRRLGSLSARLDDVKRGVNLRSYEAEFAGTDPESREFFAESMDGLVKTLYEQAPK